MWKMENSNLVWVSPSPPPLSLFSECPLFFPLFMSSSNWFTFFSSGQVFPIVESKELVQMSNFTSNNLLVDTDIASGTSLNHRHRRAMLVQQQRERLRRAFGGRTGRILDEMWGKHEMYNTPITIDDGIKKLIVSISTGWVTHTLYLLGKKEVGQKWLNIWPLTKISTEYKFQIVFLDRVFFYR